MSVLPTRLPGRRSREWCAAWLARRTRKEASKRIRPMEAWSAMSANSVSVRVAGSSWGMVLG